MKYLIDISQRQGEKIQKYLDNGLYATISQFITTAIENQFNLEDGQAFTNNIIPQETSALDQNKSSVLPIVSTFEPYKISNLQNIYSIIPPPKFDQIVLSTENRIEKNTWIWGQINKIFPVKIGLRILQKHLGSNQTIDLNDFLTEAATEAALIGNIIREYEKKNSKERNDKISAGLPQSSDEKSQSRYKFQFLAYQRKDGLLDGAMAILRFCNLEKRNGKVFIGITESGEKFSNELNPVLDEDNLDDSFSESEIEFYLKHIDKNVISESTAIKWLLGKINEGINERTLINEELTKDCGELWGASEAIINTQRSGLTARTYELGLIEKHKSGKFVTYGITPSGLKYLTPKKNKI